MPYLAKPDLRRIEIEDHAVRSVESVDAGVPRVERQAARVHEMGERGAILHEGTFDVSHPELVPPAAASDPGG
jgi:hypothetical protein